MIIKMAITILSFLQASAEEAAAAEANNIATFIKTARQILSEILS